MLTEKASFAERDAIYQLCADCESATGNRNGGKILSPSADSQIQANIQESGRATLSHKTTVTAKGPNLVLWSTSTRLLELYVGVESTSGGMVCMVTRGDEDEISRKSAGIASDEC